MKKTTAKRELPAPTMTAEEFKRRVDFEVGDIVQILQGKGAGRAAEIIGIGVYTFKGNEYLKYNLRLSDNEGIQATGTRLKLVRHADDNI